MPAVVTPIGKIKIAAAMSGGPKINPAVFIVGDGNGAPYIAAPGQTNIRREVWRTSNFAVYPDTQTPGFVRFEAIIPADIGGFTVREQAVVDEDGDTIAVANTAEVEKPLLELATPVEMIQRMVLGVGDIENINLAIDPTIVTASRDYVDQKIHELRAEIGELTDSAIPLKLAVIAPGNIADFPMSGLISDDAGSLFVTITGVEQGWDSDYSIDLSPPVPRIVFSEPPPAGAIVRARTMVSTTQHNIQEATPLVPGISRQGLVEKFLDQLEGKGDHKTFVAIAQGGTASATSSDGIIWTLRSLPVSNAWRSVTFGNGVFLAIAGGSTEAATSSDGITWTLRSLPVSNAWRSVTFGNGVFVAVVFGGAIAARSEDGITWTQTTLPVIANWQTITYGNGLFVAVANGVNIAATSPDGINWTQRTLPASTGWYAVTYGNGLFVAVANGGNIAATSSDGIDWTQRTLPASTGWYAVTYGNGLFVAVANGGNIAATSSDGIDWTQRTLPASTGWYAVTYGNGLFVAVAYSSAFAATSPDGINWTQRILPANTYWVTVAFGQNTVDTKAHVTQDMLVDVLTNRWTIRGNPSGNAALRCVVSDGYGLVFAAGDNGTIVKSTDGGMTWQKIASPASTDWRVALYIRGNNSLILAGQNGIVRRTANAGATWTTPTLPAGTPNYRAGAYGVINNMVASRRACLVGSNDTILFSIDGVTWTASTIVPMQYPFGPPYNFTDVAIGLGRCIVTTGSSVIALDSTNGMEIKYVGDDQPIDNIACGETRFVMTGEQIVSVDPASGDLTFDNYETRTSTMKFIQGMFLASRNNEGRITYSRDSFRTFGMIHGPSSQVVNAMAYDIETDTLIAVGNNGLIATMRHWFM